MRFIMNRCSRSWRVVELLSVTAILFVAWLFIYPHVPWYPGDRYFYWLCFEEDFCYHGIVFFYTHPWAYFAVLGVAWSALSILMRRRYLVIDQIGRRAVYHLPVFGKWSYYFVEIKGIQVEVDMSQVLMRLNSPKLYRLYLKLHRDKALLVSESWAENAVLDLAYKLQQVFGLKNVEHMHRVGSKRGGEIQLGNYVVEKDLTHGGMGKVLLAKDRRTQKRVALKILPASLALRENYVTNFARETRVLQSMDHPGIVKVYEVGRDSDQGKDVYFFAMEYIEGKPLSALIKDGLLDCRKSAQLILESALALDYIHKHGVVHRDIKPGNIMVRDDGSAVLIDFGIARSVPCVEKSRLEKGEEISHCVGTLPYMSPEQLLPHKGIDYRTDIYSLGVTLYEMLTGRRPFKGGVGHSISWAILTSYPPQPSAVKPEVPHELDIATMRAMEKNKYHRYDSAAEFAEDMDRFLRGMPILSREVSWCIRIWRRFRSFFRWI